MVTQMWPYRDKMGEGVTLIHQFMQQLMGLLSPAHLVEDACTLDTRIDVVRLVFQRLFDIPQRLLEITLQLCGAREFAKCHLGRRGQLGGALKALDRLIEIADSGICLAKAHNYIVIVRHCAACPGIALDGLVPLTRSKRQLAMP